MVQLTVDDSMKAVLEPLKQRTEVIDARGRRLGYFIPEDPEAELLRQKIFADYESGEYRKRRARDEGQDKYTTEQVLERLRSLGTP